MGTLEARNRQVVESYWAAHFLRDWDAMATFFSDDAHYTDKGMDGVGATGPIVVCVTNGLGLDGT